MNISIPIFKKFLKNNVVEFSYIKKNGKIYNAIGTTNMYYIKSINPNAVISTPQQPDDLIRYYDINKQCWHTFPQNNLHYFKHNLIALHY